MKIRSGFVSNSSSSSFVCDLCGNAESGYDMSIQDADMFRCTDCGKEYCISHKLSPSDDELSKWYLDYLDKKISENILDNCSYYKNIVNGGDKKKILEAEQYLNDKRSRLEKEKSDFANNLSTGEMDVRDFIRESYDEWHYEHPGCFCPICNLKALPKEETLKYVLKRFNLSEDGVLKEIKDKFNNFEGLKEYLK